MVFENAEFVSYIPELEKNYRAIKCNCVGTTGAEVKALFESNYPELKFMGLYWYVKGHPDKMYIFYEKR